ncbi:hypothetical protein VNO78_33295 [Psophocarpus tetragonolobus]|uniref:Uncharacterized protein n=1 Tax=Psophocarpus tetragonolobus TaxID=3891 RepID=A0AAN9NX46_PSOTE
MQNGDTRNVGLTNNEMCNSRGQVTVRGLTVAQRLAVARMVVLFDEARSQRVSYVQPKATDLMRCCTCVVLAL